MRVRWHGQSAYTITGASQTVCIDPFGDLAAASGGRITSWYPAIEPHAADMLLVTHEHRDHTGVDVVTGSPHVIRSTAGTFDGTPVGQVVAVASEQDDAAGTRRGPNTIFAFELDGIRICHMGDFGQPGLRPEPREAIGHVDLLFVPVGGGPTLDAEGAAAVVGELDPAWVVPMHYRTGAIEFLEPADAFLARYSDVQRADGSTVELDAGSRPGGTRVVVPAAPVGAAASA